MENSLKIVSAEIKNFQSLKMKKVDIAGRSVAVIGKNDGSKSALIRAIQSPLTSKVPDTPITKGEDEGSVIVELKGFYDGEEKTFRYSIYFDEKNQKGRITVKDEDGNEYKNKDIQQSIIGDISFDPFDFVRMGRTSTGKVSKTGVRDQINMLMEFISEEDRQKLLELDADKEKAKEDKKMTKREIENIKLAISEHGIPEEDAEKYSEDKSKELEKQEQKLSKASESNSKVESVKYKLENKKEKLQANVERMVELKAEIKKLEDENDDLAEDIKNGDEWLEKHDKEEDTTSAIIDKIQELREHQTMHGKIKQLIEKRALLEEKEKAYTDFDDKMKKAEVDKKKIFSESALPVKELEFNEEQILFKGVPLDEEHHPKSIIISIGVKIAMALNPNLKCIFIHDGSLLDKKTYEWLLKYVEKNDYQLIIEMVDWDASETSVKFAEELLNK